MNDSDRYLWAAGALDASAEEFARAASLIDQEDRAVAAATSAGVAQSELMLGHYDAAAQRAERVLHDLGEGSDDRGPTANAFATAARVAGVIRVHRGDAAGGMAMCRQAVGATTHAQVQALSTLYLGVALLDAGRYDEAATEMLAASLDAQHTGMEASFAAYLDGVAAEAFIRSGHWDRADTVLRRHDAARIASIGEVRLASAEAMIGGRRGDPRAAAELLELAGSQPLDGWHRTLVDLAACDAAPASNQWSMVDAIIERVAATEMGAQILWRSRALRFASCATVELALDAQARQERCEPAMVAAELRDRLDTARRAIDPDAPVVAGSRPTSRRLRPTSPDSTRLTRRRWSRWSIYGTRSGTPSASQARASITPRLRSRRATSRSPHRRCRPRTGSPASWAQRSSSPTSRRSRGAPVSV